LPRPLIPCCRSDDKCWGARCSRISLMHHWSGAGSKAPCVHSLAPSTLPSPTSRTRTTVRTPVRDQRTARSPRSCTALRWRSKPHLAMAGSACFRSVQDCAVAVTCGAHATLTYPPSRKRYQFCDKGLKAIPGASRFRLSFVGFIGFSE